MHKLLGIQSGDKILKINGRTIFYKSDFDKAMEKSKGEELEVIIERNGEKKTFHFKPVEEKYNYTGIAISGKEEDGTKIAALYPKSPAELQGLEVNDTIIAINDIEVKNNSQKMVEEINKNIGEKIKFKIERGKDILTIEIMPEVGVNYYMGVYLKMAENNFANNVYYAFFQTGEFSFSVIDNLRMLFTGNVSIDQMMGPVRNWRSSSRDKWFS
ncbi:MAG: PDZ domain-containing protein [Clostridia bacterium]|nr:PDZ domain-containing protein [Clostridia bacterium]